VSSVDKLEAISRHEVRMVQSYAGRGSSRVAISRRQHYLLPQKLLHSFPPLLHCNDTQLDLFTAISATFWILSASKRYRSSSPLSPRHGVITISAAEAARTQSPVYFENSTIAQSLHVPHIFEMGSPHFHNHQHSARHAGPQVPSFEHSEGPGHDPQGRRRQREGLGK
jgi:hypothetical protein